ncbi:uncharacterized protein LOC141905099 isoform X2 [Tubulanus polymorphus]
MSRQYRKTCARLLSNTISALLKEQVSFDSKLEIRGLICLTVDDQEDEIVIKLGETVETSKKTDVGPDVASSVNGIVNNSSANFHHQLPEDSTVLSSQYVPRIFYPPSCNVKAFSDQQPRIENPSFTPATTHHSSQKQQQYEHTANSFHHEVDDGDYDDIKTQMNEPEIVAAHSSYKLERPIFRVHSANSTDNEPVNLVAGRLLAGEYETYRENSEDFVERCSSESDAVIDGKSSPMKQAKSRKRMRTNDAPNTASRNVDKIANGSERDDGESAAGSSRKEGTSPDSKTNRSVITGHSVASLSRGPLMLSEDTAPTTNNALLKCSICSLGFEALNSCIDHYKSTHRLYLCHICYKTFSQQASLQRHIRLHTGAKPYTCNLCKASFYRLDSLHNHKVRIHLHSKFICPLCPKETFVYNDRGGLRQHLKVKHSIIKMAFCPCCNKCFPVWSEFLQHRKSCSGISNANCTDSAAAAAEGNLITDDANV